MRFSAPAIVLCLTLAATGSVLVGKPKPLVVDARSAAYAAQGDAAQRAGRNDEAVGLYETALALDPANRAAFVALGDIANRQGLSGKAITLYRAAIALDANDSRAIAGEGEALAAKGAIARAKQNLAKVEQVCGGTCPEATRLNAAIARGAVKPVVQASAVMPNPTISEQPAPEQP